MEIRKLAKAEGHAEKIWRLTWATLDVLHTDVSIHFFLPVA